MAINRGWWYFTQGGCSGCVGTQGTGPHELQTDKVRVDNRPAAGIKLLCAVRVAHTAGRAAHTAGRADTGFFLHHDVGRGAGCQRG